MNIYLQLERFWATCTTVHYFGFEVTILYRELRVYNIPRGSLIHVLSKKNFKKNFKKNSIAHHFVQCILIYQAYFLDQLRGQL